MDSIPHGLQTFQEAVAVEPVDRLVREHEQRARRGSFRDDLEGRRARVADDAARDADVGDDGPAGRERVRRAVDAAAGGFDDALRRVDARGPRRGPALQAVPELRARAALRRREHLVGGRVRQSHGLEVARRLRQVGDALARRRQRLVGELQLPVERGLALEARGVAGRRQGRGPLALGAPGVAEAVGRVVEAVGVEREEVLGGVGLDEGQRLAEELAALGPLHELRRHGGGARNGLRPRGGARSGARGCGRCTGRPLQDRPPTTADVTKSSLELS
mmetsp:Transcript_22611/g.77828  ORF Transcript_22611/g.77828 Transcript_22611/m.77828 type:complete len:276 (+) Transcript_22611:1207-2034(+)